MLVEKRCRANAVKRGTKPTKTCFNKNPFLLPSLLAGLGLMLLVPSVVQAQFTYTTNNGTITLLQYTGPDGAVTIPATITGLPVTSIGGVFWDHHGLTGVTIPNTVTNIGVWEFYSCISLTNVTIPNSIVTIGIDAFFNCTSLTSVTIPDSVIDIGEDAFGYCTSLTAITVDVLNPSYSSVDGLLFDKHQTTLLRAPEASAGTYVIPESVTSIGIGAFSACTGLTTITIPQSVTEFVSGFDGPGTFAYCPNLRSVFFQGNPPSFVNSLFANLFGGDTTVFYLPGTTGWNTNYGGAPTAFWTLPYPVILNSSVGMQSDQFGFTVSWATNASVAIEASTTLPSSVWQPLKTNSLSGGTFYFNDPQWTNHPSRFYRVHSQ
jgi:hypothetical protein